MPEREYVQAAIDPATKAEAEAVLVAAGLTTSQAIRNFFTRIARDRRLPYDMFDVDDGHLDAARRSLEQRDRRYDSRRDAAQARRRSAGKTAG